MTWTTEPIDRSEALSGRPRGRPDQPDALLPEVVSESWSPGSGPVSRKSTSAGQRHQRHRADQGVADERTPAEAGLLRALLEDGDRGGPVLVGAALEVPLLDPLLVGHERLGPVHRAGADAEQGQEHPQAEQQVRELNLAQVRRRTRHGPRT